MSFIADSIFDMLQQNTIFKYSLSNEHKTKYPHQEFLLEPIMDSKNAIFLVKICSIYRHYWIILYNSINIIEAAIKNDDTATIEAICPGPEDFRLYLCNRYRPYLCSRNVFVLPDPIVTEIKLIMTLKRLAHTVELN